MKVITGVACCLFFLCIAVASGRPPAQADKPQKPKTQKFSALAYMPSGGGRRMVGAGATTNVDLYVKNYTSDDEARVLAKTLLDGGPGSLLKALEKADSLGKITRSAGGSASTT